MSIGQQDHEVIGQPAAPRRIIAPALDLYEVRRLVLVGGCIAVAAAANYANSPLPQRAPVAVGSAMLGILLVLRRRPSRSKDEPASGLTVDDETTPTSASTPLNVRRRGANQAVQALAASLAMLERQLETHEKRLTSLSGRQSLLHVESREKITEFDTRLLELEGRMSEMERQAERIRGHHLELLRHLNDSLSEHRQSLVELAERTDHRA